MSIRLRFTLLYNAILAVTLVVFGTTLYTIQSRSTMDALKEDLMRSSESLQGPMLRSVTEPWFPGSQPPREVPPPVPFGDFSSDESFIDLPEREIVRVLDVGGNLLASPFGRSEDALPLTTEGLDAVQNFQGWWETASVQGVRMLIYTRPVTFEGQVAFILQVARPLTERDRSLHALGTTLIAASLVILLVAFGIGWVLSGVTLNPIQRITQTARAIGDERDFMRRVDYSGPQDEVGQLAMMFNSMLERLQDAYQRVAHSLQLQRNFVADVSHELRTPLTTLRGNLGLLRREPAIPEEEQEDILNDMVVESDRLIRLVNDLLAFARLEAGRGLERESIEIYPVLEETCRQARQLDPLRQITLDAPADLAFLGDRDAFKQVLLIALDNAIKHSDGAISLKAEETGTGVEICIQDHGEGIPADILEHIFDRFYRGEDAPAIPGLGLGLSIAKALVEGQGGTIRMESEVGKGSTLTMSFLN